MDREASEATALSYGEGGKESHRWMPYDHGGEIGAYIARQWEEEETASAWRHPLEERVFIGRDGHGVAVPAEAARIGEEGEIGDYVAGMAQARQARDARRDGLAPMADVEDCP